MKELNPELSRQVLYYGSMSPVLYLSFLSPVWSVARILLGSVTACMSIFTDWLGELLVHSLISQHHTLKFRVFISRLYITPAISIPTCECTDSCKCKTMKSLAPVQGPLCSVELLPFACSKISLSSAHSHGRAFGDHPDFWRETNIWTEYWLKNSSPLCGNHYPKVTSWVSPVSGLRKIAAVSQNRTSLVTGAFLFNCLVLPPLIPYSSLLVVRKVSPLALSTQWFTTYQELWKRKLSKASF